MAGITKVLGQVTLQNRSVDISRVAELPIRESHPTPIQANLRQLCQWGGKSYRWEPREGENRPLQRNHLGRILRR